MAKTSIMGIAVNPRQPEIASYTVEMDEGTPPAEVFAEGLLSVACIQPDLQSELFLTPGLRATGVAEKGIMEAVAARHRSGNLVLPGQSYRLEFKAPEAVRLSDNEAETVVLPVVFSILAR